MATTKLTTYATGTLAITSINSLASDTTVGYLVACSAAFDNTSNLYLDVLPYLTVSYPNSAPTVAYLTCYYASYINSVWSDDGYSDAPDGTDQTITIGSPTCLRYAGTVPILQNKITTAAPLLSVASVFGYVPEKFCVVVANGSGQTINGSGNACGYSAVTATTA